MDSWCFHWTRFFFSIWWMAAPVVWPRAWWTSASYSWAVRVKSLVPPCSFLKPANDYIIWVNDCQCIHAQKRHIYTYNCVILCVFVCVFSSCTGHIPRFPFRVPRFPISWSPSAPMAPGGGHLNSLFRYSPSPRRLPAIFVAEDLSLPLPRCASGYGLERSPSDQKKWRLVYLVSQDLHCMTPISEESVIQSGFRTSHCPKNS